MPAGVCAPGRASRPPRAGRGHPWDDVWTAIPRCRTLGLRREGRV